MFITYEGAGEVLITSTEDENGMLEEYFGPESGRVIFDYQRQSWADVTAVVVESSVKVGC